MKITPANDEEEFFYSSSFEKKQDIISPYVLLFHLHQHQ